MTHTVLLACEMMKAEIEAAVANTGFQGPVVWMEKGLHERPETLRAALQEEIGRWDGRVGTILLGYGLCGRGTLGLTARESRLILPKFDDCVRALLSLKGGCPIVCDARALYYTESWLDFGESALLSYRKYEEKYGARKADRIMKTMLAGYRHAALIDTGLYDLDEAEAILAPEAARMSLTVKRVPGSLRVWEKLLTGPWDDEFVTALPGGTIRESAFDDRSRCVTED